MKEDKSNDESSAASAEQDPAEHSTGEQAPPQESDSQ